MNTSKQPEPIGPVEPTSEGLKKADEALARDDKELERVDRTIEAADKKIKKMHDDEALGTMTP
jgi:hypothetical protein